MAREFKTIGVIGLGTMGAGIAEVFARNGYAVVGVELNDDTLARGRAHLDHSTSRAVARGKLSDDEQKALLDRITFTTNLSDAKDADLVVEAVVESLDVKRTLMQALDGIVREDTVLATNTSSL
jgi:3-hydroxybutyryl-CoA dehydrogenase